NAGTADKDVAWLKALAAQRTPRLSITSRDDLALIAVQGPAARAKVWGATNGADEATRALKPFSAATVRSEWGELFIARTGYTGEDGFEIVVAASKVADLWNALRAAGVAPCGLGARDTLRLEAGMNLYGQDMDASVTPFEAGLRWTVDLTPPRAFVGREALATRAPRHQLLGLLLLGKGVLRAHQPVRTAAGEGMMTDGHFPPATAT